jgi:hypothetical protein
MQPTPVTYTHRGDVLTANPPHAELRIELTHDSDLSTGACSLAWENDTPIRFTVSKPHDRTIVDEAASVLAAVYWSRVAASLGAKRGEVHIIDGSNS